MRLFWYDIYVTPTSSVNTQHYFSVGQYAIMAFYFAFSLELYCLVAHNSGSTNSFASKQLSHQYDVLAVNHILVIKNVHYLVLGLHNDNVKH